MPGKSLFSQSALVRRAVSCLAENFKTYKKAGSNRESQVEFNGIGRLQPDEGIRSCSREYDRGIDGSAEGALKAGFSFASLL
jgi:hypothetical protein